MDLKLGTIKDKLVETIQGPVVEVAVLKVVYSRGVSRWLEEGRFAPDRPLRNFKRLFSASKGEGKDKWEAPPIEVVRRWFFEPKLPLYSREKNPTMLTVPLFRNTLSLAGYAS